MNYRTPTLMLGASDRLLQLQVSTTNNWQETCQSKTQLNLNQWTHIICWCDGKNLKIFIDGKLDGELKLKGRLLINSCPLYVNKVPFGLQKADAVQAGIEGSIEDMRLYLRAITQEEINLSIAMATQQKLPNVTINSPTTNLEELAEFVKQSNLTLDMDAQLVEMVSIGCKDSNRDPFDLDVETFIPTSSLMLQFPLINQIPLSILKFRFDCIRWFNFKLLTVFPLIDFSQSHLPWSLAHTLIKLKDIIFLQTKQQLWGNIITTTNSNRGAQSVQIDRPRALKAKESKFHYID